MIYKYNESMMPSCIDIFYDIYTSDEFCCDFLTKENIKTYFEEITSNNEFQGFVFIKNKKIVGMCFGLAKWNFGNKFYEIGEICITNEFRGSGLGTSFMESIEMYLKKQNFKSVSLHTRRDMRAYDFYMKNDFKEKDSVVSMIKTL